MEEIENEEMKKFLSSLSEGIRLIESQWFGTAVYHINSASLFIKNKTLSSLASHI